MAVQKILHYPHPILKGRSETVREINSQTIQIIKNLLDTLGASPGVAIAAPQIGEAHRIIVCDVSRKVKEKHHGRLVLINPVIRRGEGKKLLREGCLSVPDYTGNTNRFERVWVEGLDAEGRPLSLVSEGFEALAIQHEIDHLDGILFLDRIASLNTDLFRRKTH